MVKQKADTTIRVYPQTRKILRRIAGKNHTSIAEVVARLAHGYQWLV